MPFYQFTRKQVIPASLRDVWDFIAAPQNLKMITPEYMGFDIISENLRETMYQGMIIHYKVSPLLGIKTDWVSEITHIRDLEYFVDEQRLGPYKFWHHQHLIEEVSQGVAMTDIVSYAPPFGLIGALSNRWIIKGKLKEIFDFRKNAIAHYFAKPSDIIQKP